MLFAAAPTARAAIITHIGQTQEQGVGLGNVILGLVLQATGGSTTEIGSVLFDSATMQDVRSGDAQPQSQTVTLTALSAHPAGYTAGQDLFLVFNINEPGTVNFVTLNSLELVFYDAAGTVIDTAVLGGPATDFEMVGGGTGAAGQLFLVTNVPADFTRIGMSADISNVAGGAENFYFAPAGAFPVIPEPATILAAVTALPFGFLALRRRLRRPSVEAVA